MLALFGDDYIIQHCLAEAERDKREDLFRTYVANSIHYLAQGKAVGRSYSDIISDIENPVEEERSGDEIKKSIKDGFNSLIRKGGENHNGFDESGGNAGT